jgi:protein-tyrosine phosphatase
MKASPGTGGIAQHPVTVEGAGAAGDGEGVPAGHEGCGQRCWREVGQARGPRDGIRFRILYVCTGNVCRSPLAERLTRAALGPCPAVQVISAGTHAESGREMTEHARRVLIRLGGDPTGFGSRPLVPELVAAADLVLTATCGHRAESVAMHFAAATRTFTIAEFGTLVRAVSPEEIIRHRDPARRARALADEVRALRGLVRVDQPDIADPYRRSRLVYQMVGRSIARSLAVPLGLLTR